MAVAQAFGAEIAWFCEYEPACRQVLERHHPDIPIHPDVRELNDPDPVDILCGGYPCQPFSKAGKRKGADDSRHLWPEFARLLRLLRPRYAVLENVAGHLSLGFDEVLCDLAEAGFDAEWIVVRASDAGAPHRRERLFCLAHANGERRMVGGAQEHPAVGGQPPLSEPSQRDQQAFTDPCGVGWGTGPGLRSGDARGDGRGLTDDNSGKATSDSDISGSQTFNRRPWGGDSRRFQPVVAGEQAVEWGAYGPAIARWERITRRAPRPVDDRGRLSVSFVEWMQGLPAGWVDGLSRTHALKALGNCVVPQQAHLALEKLCGSVI